MFALSLLAILYGCFNIDISLWRQPLSNIYLQNEAEPNVGTKNLCCVFYKLTATPFLSANFLLDIYRDDPRVLPLGWGYHKSTYSGKRLNTGFLRGVSVVWAIDIADASDPVAFVSFFRNCRRRMPISQIQKPHIWIFVHESHLTSEIPSEIDRKSDPKSNGIVQIWWRNLFWKQKRKWK